MLDKGRDFAGGDIGDDGEGGKEEDGCWLGVVVVVGWSGDIGGRKHKSLSTEIISIYFHPKYFGI